ncbi:GAF domain-containing protein [Marinobacter oulmenensis]|uniref:histidine kinase n=1 Tax=Marinobacter oulmenensis TaxID=643747 RepID=A0A840U420_9GAMM|nr:GAF domain-containing protein [Marinobacter oulmenensis]MBB5319632.1 signal transduction histidine kinase/GAF domain-containing protein [Marinobacter oulmenensis]
MKPADATPDEARRQNALDRTGLLDTRSEERFDRITRTAARLFDVPIALVSLVDHQRQWFKSRYGLDATQTARDISFCGHAIQSDSVFVIEDAEDDNRFCDNPLVCGEPGIRFYAGAPVRDHEGYRLGTLCVIDRKPRAFSAEDKDTLRDLADIVEREVQLRELGSYYGERDRALNILNEIALDTEGPAHDRIRAALRRACHYLDMDTGIVSQITGPAYTILWHHTRVPFETVYDGLTLPLEQTYSSLLMESHDVIAFDHTGQSEYQLHPAYQEYGLESYLAAPIWIDGEVMGSVNFSSRAPRQQPFTETDRMFVNLLARWASDIIHQQQQTETLNKLAKHAPGMLYQYRQWPDGHSTFPYTSPGIREIYDVPSEGLANDASPVFACIHPDDLDPVAEAIRHSATDLTLWHCQYRVQRRSGTWHWVEGQANPERLPDGSILWHGYIMDINERRKAEEMKSQFISTVSHELRTPLTSISGSLSLVLGGATGELPDKALQMLTIAQRNALHLRTLIDDLLDIEKLVNGRMPIYSAARSLQDAVASAIEEIQPYAEKRQVLVTLEDSGTHLQAIFDLLRFRQALTNLLSNAVKFSPEQAKVSVRIRAGENEAWVEVEDRGPGIPDSFRPSVFEKFAQAESHLARNQEGTGLGLAITRELMRAMGGSVGFESEEGRGARFWVSLPLAKTDVR